jgi:hypothetical protein
VVDQAVGFSVPKALNSVRKSKSQGYWKMNTVESGSARARKAMIILLLVFKYKSPILHYLIRYVNCLECNHFKNPDYKYTCGGLDTDLSHFIGRICSR